MNEKKLCDYGCGQKAIFQIRGGKWCCSNYFIKCPTIANKFDRSKCSWNKGKTKGNDERIKKGAETLKERIANGDIKSYWTGKHLSNEHKQKLSNSAGGFKRGSGRGTYGWYKGYWCDSSWELAWVIYNLEHNVKFERNTQGFEYEFEGKKHKYYPDFKMEDGSYTEVKGWLDEKNKTKIAQFDGLLNVLCKREIKLYLKYVIDKYGKDYVSLYDNYVKPTKTKQSMLCKKCGKIIGIHGKSGLCASCVHLGVNNEKARKVNRPLKDELEKLVIEMPMTKIGLKYGVSDNAIRRWCKGYGIELVNRLGYWTKRTTQ